MYLNLLFIVVNPCAVTNNQGRQVRDERSFRSCYSVALRTLYARIIWLYFTGENF